jgi:hypothetical protein
VESGLVLLTQAGDTADHVLGAGEELHLRATALVAIWALEAAQIAVLDGAPGATARVARAAVAV